MVQLVEKIQRKSSVVPQPDMQGLIDLVNQLHQKEIHFKSITDNVDTSTPAGRFFFHVMASLAQMERELIAERTKAGLAAAKAKGRIGGRKRKMTQSKIESAKQLLSSGSLPKDVAQNLGISVPTLPAYPVEVQR